MPHLLIVHALQPELALNPTPLLEVEGVQPKRKQKDTANRQFPPSHHGFCRTDEGVDVSFMTSKEVGALVKKSATTALRLVRTP
jgi:hypothetical protein